MTDAEKRFLENRTMAQTVLHEAITNLVDAILIAAKIEAQVACIQTMEVIARQKESSNES